MGMQTISTLLSSCVIDKPGGMFSFNSSPLPGMKMHQRGERKNKNISNGDFKHLETL